MTILKETQSMNHILRHRSLGALLLLVLAALVAVAPVAAQQANPVSFGTAVFGTVSPDGTPVAYSFTGNFGDLVTMRAAGTTPGMDPNLQLLGPDQIVLATNENSIFDPASTAASIVFRLPETGTYTVVVGGTPGDFLLTLDVRPVLPVVPLVIDQPTQLVFPLPVPDQIFSFNTNPTLPTTLHVNFEPLFTDFLVEVRGGSGQLVAALNADFDNACLSFSPGDETFEVRAVSGPGITGTVDFALSNGPCDVGAPPVNFVVPTRVFEPIPIQGVCAASAPTNVNVRFGPGLEWPVIALLPARVPIQVIGVSTNGWFAVQRGTLTGWLFSGVVTVIGPCDTVPAAQPPVATPTPTMTFTPAVTVITTTPGPTTTAQVVTATPGPATATTQPPATEVPPTVTTVPLTAVPTETPEPPAGEATATATLAPPTATATATATTGA
jgi:uncharacterized protein YraI